MSRDGYICKIKKLDLKGDIVDSKTLDWDSYRYVEASYAPDYMKKHGRKIKVIHHLIDYSKASLDHFKKKYTSMTYLCDGSITFYDEKRTLGTLYREEIEKYNYTDVKESYIIRIEEIASMDNCYRLSLSSGIHTFEEMFEECLRIVNEEESDSFYSSNVVYGLLKAMSYARKGDIILFYID